MPDRPTRLHLLVEGQTEETVVRNVLEPHLAAVGFAVSQSILVTSQPAGRAWHRGGVSSWARIVGDVRRLLRDSSLDILTTVIDYYGLPDDAPGMSSRPHGSARSRVEHVEARMAAAVDDRRFVPNLVLHETETWVFAAADQLAELQGDPELAGRLRAQADAAGGVELINEGPQTAPSKRIQRLCPDYMKTSDGPLVISELGLPALRKDCPHLEVVSSSVVYGRPGDGRGVDE